MTLKFAYGDRYNADDLPEASVQAMVNRGITHYMGSEQASKVTTWKVDFEKEQGREPTEDEVLAEKLRHQDAAWATLVEGKVGEGSRGPRGTPLETLMAQIAADEIKVILGKSKLSMPSGDKTVKFANGDEFTRKQLIDRRLANESHAARIKAEAEKELRARERKAAKVAAEGEGSALDAIG